MRPIRILHVFGGLDSGGAESRTMDIYRELDREKVQFDFLVHTDKVGFFENEIIRMGGKIHRVPRFSLKTVFSYPKAIIDFFQSYPKYQIIHGHMLSTAFIYLSIAKIKKTPFRIAHSRCASRAERDPINKLKNVTDKLSRFPSTHLFAVSKVSGISMFGKKRIENQEVNIIPNAINTKKFLFNNKSRDALREELQLKNSFVVGHIGRFETQKNHLFLLDVFAEIVQSEPSAKLMLIGEGIMQSKIENKIAKLKLKRNVMLLGVRDDVENLLQTMDVLMFPSLHEGLPGVVLEAQAAGLPCVISAAITDEVKLTELVEYVSLKKSTEKWAKIVIDAGKRTIRRNTYKDIATAGYDIIDVAKWYETFYLNTIEKKFEQVKERRIPSAKKEYRNYDS